MQQIFSAGTWHSFMHRSAYQGQRHPPAGTLPAVEPSHSHPGRGHRPRPQKETSAQPHPVAALLVDFTSVKSRYIGALYARLRRFYRLFFNNDTCILAISIAQSPDMSHYAENTQVQAPSDLDTSLLCRYGQMLKMRHLLRHRPMPTGCMRQIKHSMPDLGYEATLA